MRQILQAFPQKVVFSVPGWPCFSDSRLQLAQPGPSDRGRLGARLSGAALDGQLTCDVKDIPGFEEEGFLKEKRRACLDLDTFDGRA